MVFYFGVSAFHRASSQLLLVHDEAYKARGKRVNSCNNPCGYLEPTTRFGERTRRGIEAIIYERKRTNSWTILSGASRVAIISKYKASKVNEIIATRGSATERGKIS
jgi:hypothetical protein